MANVSSSNGIEKYPKLRFPEFTEPWAETQLSALFNKNTKKNNDGFVTNVISNSAKNGLIPQKDYFDKDIANADNTAGYYIIQKNDFVYNPRKSTDAPYGPISRYTFEDDGIVSPLYLCFRGNMNVNPDYFEKYFKSSAWHRYIYMSGDSGARHDRVSIKDETFFEMPIIMPCEHEQDKIATFLSTLEQKIEKQAALVDNLKKYKRGVSNKLFTDIQSNANNHTYCFSDIFKILQNNTFSRDMLCTEKTKVLNIHYGDVLIKYNAVTNIETTEIPYIKENIDLSKFLPISYLESGDVVFADTAEDYTVGKATEIQSENKVFILSGLHTIPCRPIINFHKGYLGHYFNSSAYRTDILPLIQGTKVSSISKTELLKTSVVVPPLEQQQKIAELLSAIDNKIDCLKLEVYKLMKLKFGLLQQLFI